MLERNVLTDRLSKHNQPHSDFNSNMLYYRYPTHFFGVCKQQEITFVSQSVGKHIYDLFLFFVCVCVCSAQHNWVHPLWINTK